MFKTQMGTVQRYVQSLTVAAPCNALPDAELLEQFSKHDQTSAFVTLVKRHGPLVWRVCRQVSGNEQDAEDAFQATFLVLLRNARSIQKGVSVGSWLHGVAYRTAMKAKRSAARRRIHEGRLKVMSRELPVAESAWDSLNVALDEEINRLPAREREAFVCCYLEGKSAEQAAGELGCKERTVYSAIKRARKRLEQQLVQRGILLATVLAAIPLARSAAAASLPTRLVTSTIRAGSAYANGKDVAGIISSEVLKLVNGGSKTMLMSKLKLFLPFVLVLTASAMGLVVNSAVQQSAIAKEQTTPGQMVSQTSLPIAKKVVGTLETTISHNNIAANDIKISGSVLDPGGKPIAGAKVYLTLTEAKNAEPAMRTESDAQGRFSFSVKLGEGDKGLTREMFNSAQLVAVADGYAVDWSEPGKLDDPVTLRLGKAGPPIRGRILNLEGKPLQDLSVSVGMIAAPTDDRLATYFKSLKEAKFPSQYGIYRLSKRLSPPKLLGSLGTAATTDKDGRFELPSCGEERLIALSVQGQGIARAEIIVCGKDVSDTEMQLAKAHSHYGPRFEYEAAPGKVITGVVSEKGSGKPLAGVNVAARANQSICFTKTDAEGKFRIEGIAKADSYRLSLNGYYHFNFSKEVADTAGFDPVDVSLEMEKGVRIQGRFIDKITGKPVRGMIRYEAASENPNLKDAPNWASVGTFGGDSTANDGTFSIVGLPGKGYLSFRAHEDRYIAADLIDENKKSIAEVYSAPNQLIAPSNWHSFTVIDVMKDKPQTLQYEVKLDPGTTVTGTVIGPDNKPMEGAFAYGLTALANFYPLANDKLTKSDFTVTGLNGRSVRRLLFLSPDRKFGKAVELGPNERGPLTVKLEPLGALTGRIVDGQGKPIAGINVSVTDTERPLGVNGVTPSWRLGFFPSNTVDQKGVYRLEGMLPGLKVNPTIIDQGRVVGAIAEGVVIPAKETKDLGDFKYERQ
jgi:RNA polymerase sigma factor (sigma-70 family)